MNIGIDIGGTTVGIGFIDDREELILSSEIATDRSYDIGKIEDDIIAQIDKGLSELEIAAESIEAIGVGIPGIVDPENNKVVVCPNTGWRGEYFGKKMVEKYGVPVVLENDANVAAYGEYSHGRLKSFSTGMVLTLGTGVGGGLIIDGKLYRGAHGAGSEVGHMIIGDNFYSCKCGRNGCLETFSSATAIVKYANHISGEEGKYNDSREIFKLYREGDPVAAKVVERFTKSLGLGIVNVIATMDPEIVVLSGGVSRNAELYIEELRDIVSDMRFFEEVEPPIIEASRMGNKVAQLGAALLARDYGRVVTKS